MRKLGLAIAAIALIGMASGVALGQGRGGHGGGGAMGGHGGGGAMGGHGGGGAMGGSGAGAPVGRGGGHGWAGGGGGRPWAGGGMSGQWSGGHGGGYRGGYGGYKGWYGGYRGGYGGYRAWYGPGFYFGWPYWGVGYPYPYYYANPGYYAYPGYYYSYPYPAYYGSPAPTVYIERPPVVAAAPPAPVPAPPAAAPKFERTMLSAKELFAFDRADLRTPQPKLDEIADALNRNPQIAGVKIIGYTDRLGSDSYNTQLSQRRAEAVKAYLVGKGVGANRLTAIGRGKADPLVQCEGRAGAALIACLEPNRRVEIEPFTIERPYG